MTRWQLETETAIQIRPAPGKSVADDSADIVAQEPGYIVGAVCDGVTGSEGGGGRAADIALRALMSQEWHSIATQKTVEQRLVESIRLANDAVRGGSQHARNGKTVSHGSTTTCTLGAVYVVDGRCFTTVAWVGDSPAEIVGSYGLRLITPLDTDSSSTAPPALGARGTVSPSVKTLEIRPGEALLLHSDGFCLDESECQRIYRNSIAGGHGWQKFLEQAMGASQVSDDDKSAVVIGLMSEPRQDVDVLKPVTTASKENTTSTHSYRAVTPPSRPAGNPWLAVVIILAILASGAVGVIVGRQKTTSDTLNSIQASLNNRGVRGAGEQFIIARDGTILPISGLLNPDAGSGSRSVKVYKLVRDDAGKLAVKPVSTLVISQSKVGTAEKIVFNPPIKDARVYLDGARVEESPAINLTGAQEHTIAFYSSNPTAPFGYKIVPKDSKLVIISVTPGPEPVQ